MRSTSEKSTNAMGERTIQRRWCRVTNYDDQLKKRKRKSRIVHVENVLWVTSGVHLLLRPPVPAWAKLQNSGPNQSDQNGEEGQEKG
jgi:hypothetical protein